MEDIGGGLAFSGITGETRLISVDPDGGKVKHLIQPKSTGKVDSDEKHYPQFRDRVISFLPDDPEHVLVSVDLEQPTYDSVYIVDIKSDGRLVKKRSRKPIRGWIADQQGRVRAGVGYDYDDAIFSLWTHDLEKDEWEQRWTYKLYSEQEVTPLGFGLDPNTLYVRTLHEGRDAIFTVSTKAGSKELTLVASDPDYDIEGGLIYSPRTRDAVGVYHGEAEDLRIYWDKNYQQFQQAINRALPDTTNEFVSFSDNERQYIIFASSDTDPGSYYIGDLDKKYLNHFLEQRPLLTETTLASRKKISYKTRDGLELEAYLTLPSSKNNGPLGTIVLPHGGPATKDYGGFNLWAAFFADQGYAVIQPNFRGSTGYGYEFKYNSVKEYGKEMQNDLTDATNWTIEQGIADPKRICIVGANYGGYAAMMGTVKTPELFRCAISFGGIADLVDLRESFRDCVSKELAFEYFGDDSKKLESTSPRHNISKINTPILLIHGDHDRVIDADQSRNMAETLDDAGKEYTYLELENGSHGLTSQKNRDQTFNIMQKFLAKYLSS